MTNQEEYNAAIELAAQARDSLRSLSGVVEHLRVISQREALLAASSASSVTNRKQLNRVITDLNAIRRANYEQIDFVIRDGLRGLEPTADVSSLLLQFPLVGTYYHEWINVAEVRETQRVKAAMRMALINKEDAVLLGQRLTEAYDASKRSLASLVATVGNMVINETRMAEMRAAGVKHWRIVALIDSNTSPQTLAMMGVDYEVGNGPHLPLHIGGRSIATPVHEGGGPFPDLETLAQWSARQAAQP